MSPGGLAFLIVAGVLIIALPRRLIAIPLLLAAAYTVREPIIALGPANLSVLRVLVVIGALRVLLRGERITGGLNSLDRLILAWAALLVVTSAFHTSDAWAFRIGMILGEVGTYLLLRVSIQDLDDVEWLFRTIPLALAPLALLMLYEKYTQQNPFTIMGGPGIINIREGHVRAYGALAHPILAGTVGATCVPMALYLWRQERFRALLGLAASLGIVYASTSSGPVMMVAFAILGMLLWNMRQHLRLVRWSAFSAIVTLQLVMNDPVYFLMARIDITGGSTGWHRAQLVRSALEHLNEWWLVGSDYTRHWMPTGIPANAIHTDITNHFLAMGVLGGLPLLILFVSIVVVSFRAVGRSLRQLDGRLPERAFLIWTSGAILFAHVMNFLAISLFDQSVTFFYLTLAMISAALVGLPVTASDAVTPNPKREANAMWRTISGSSQNVEPSK